VCVASADKFVSSSCSVVYVSNSTKSYNLF